MPSDGVIQLAFDRYLLPATATRQSYAIVDNLNQQLPNDAIRTIYDPIARTITIAGPDGPGIPWLTQGNVYKLILPIPADLNDTSDVGGFRAIDGSPLAKNQTREFAFTAGPPSGITTIDPPVDFCADVEPIFTAKCSYSTCHGALNQEAASLVLDSASGVQHDCNRPGLAGLQHGRPFLLARYAGEPFRRRHGDHSARRPRLELAHVQVGAGSAARHRRRTGPTGRLHARRPHGDDSARGRAL